MRIILETPRLLLRELVPSDLDFVAGLHAEGSRPASRKQVPDAID
jgi:hypothetical protein